MLAIQKNGGWLSVPQFGDWDQRGQVPDYSLDFSKIRETRKQNKTNISRASLGNEEEFVDSTSISTSSVNTTGHSSSASDHQHHHQTHSPTVRFHSFTPFYLILSFVIAHYDYMSNVFLQPNFTLNKWLTQHKIQWALVSTPKQKTEIQICP